MSFSTRAMVSADLQANAGTQGLWNGFWAFMVNPGFAVMLLHRVALWLKAKRQNRLADLVWHWNVRRSGCHFHLDAVIGPGLKLPHPVGIVIGQGSHIGTGVTLYQGVTIGKLPRSERYPVIADGALIFPNSVVAGGITIGRDAIVGALSYVDRNVPDGAVATGAPARIRHNDIAPAAASGPGA